ncbi:MAG: c-type cytochrome [Kofleriaceae bacterium]
MPSPRSILLVLALASLPLPVHADDSPPASPVPSVATHAIRGKVRFAGTPPTPETIHAHHDSHVCGKGGPMVDESLLVDASGGLANTIVVIQGVTPVLAAVAAPGPSRAPSLDQRNCTFIPHAQSVTQGSELAIQSNDPILHNIHGFLGKRTVFNLAIPVANKVVSRRLDEAGIIRIRCDSGHTWMSAYIAVVPHRFHATTARDGSFEIAGLPRGSYTLRAWHEKLGAVEQRVEVADGDAQISMTFRAPSSDTPAPRTPPAEPSFDDALISTRTAVQQVDERQRAEQRARYLSEGRPLFHKFCATCHGDRANGTGPSARFTSTPPRDLTRGTFKFRMTPAGSPPSEADLVRTIAVGVRGTHMPSWRGTLTRAQITTLARYVMALSDAFWTGTPLPPPLDIPAEPPYDQSSVARGKALYAKMSCATCHGSSGAGNGQAAAALKDDWGHSIKPADFTTGVFKGGCCGAAVFRAISTGLAGTPMPAFGGAMTDAERWDLSHYIVSLGRHRPAVDYLLAPAGRITPP